MCQQIAEAKHSRGYQVLSAGFAARMNSDSLARVHCSELNGYVFCLIRLEGVSKFWMKFQEITEKENSGGKKKKTRRPLSLDSVETEIAFFCVSIFVYYYKNQYYYRLDPGVFSQLKFFLN